MLGVPYRAANETSSYESRRLVNLAILAGKSGGSFNNGLYDLECFCLTDHLADRSLVS